MPDYKGQAVIVSGINLVAGAWLILAPFILGFSGVAPQAAINDIIVGILTAVISGIRIFTSSKNSWISWVNVILGFWLIIAPFALSYPLSTPRVNDIVIGILIIILGTWSATSS